MIVVFMVAEVTAGLPQLVARAALRRPAPHADRRRGAGDLTDRGAGLAARPAHGAMTFGLGRAEILSAQANGLTLLVLGGLIVYGAISPPSSIPRTSTEVSCSGWRSSGSSSTCSPTRPAEPAR